MKIQKIRGNLRRIYMKSTIKPHFLQHWYAKRKRLRDKNRVVTKMIDGITYELHLNQLIDSEIFYYGCFEEDTTRAISEIVKPGMTVLDIGANIGAHSLRLAKLVGGSGGVIAFEPMEWAQKRLRANIDLNSFSNISVEKIALSDEDTTGPAAFKTSWSKYDDASDSIELEENISFQRLDAYVKKHDLSSIDFIKLDVDGFEYKILTGAVETLERFKPTLSMELGNWTLEEQGDNLEGLVNLLASLGYKFFREADMKHLQDFDAIMREFPDPETWTINVIVAHETKIPD